MRSAALIVITMSVSMAGVTGAQERAKGGVPDTLVRSDSISGREVVTGVYTWAPNTHTEWHTHFGEMVGHVTEGRVVLEQQGKPAATFHAGETFIVPAGVPHDCVNDTADQTRVFVTYVVEKGKPLTAPFRR
jgi:quercetin dioxygenase-like cupin family protein